MADGEDVDRDGLPLRSRERLTAPQIFWRSDLISGRTGILLKQRRSASRHKRITITSPSP